MRYFAVLFLFCLWHPLSSRAEVIHLNDQGFVNIGKKTSQLEDQKGTLSIQQVIAMDKAGKFKPSLTNVLALGNTKSAFWVKINYTGTAKTRSYLIVDIPAIERIDCYTFNHEGVMKHYRAGSLAPAEQDVIALNYYGFPLPELNGDAKASTVYVRVQSRNIMLVPLKLTSGRELFSGTDNLHLENIYIGTLLSLFIFNCFLFFSLSDKTYLYYSSYVFFLFIYIVLYLRGHSYLFGDQFRIWLNLYPHIFHGFAVISSILFSKKFLNLKSTSPSLSRFCNVLVFFGLLEIVISMLGYKPLAASFSQYLGVVATVVLFGAGVRLWLKGDKPAKYYVVASSAMAVTIIIFTLSMAGMVTVNDFTFNLLPLGSTADLLLLAFALGDRYRDLIRSERRIKDENLRLIRNQNERLEQVVEDRTIQLNNIIVELENSNAVKNKLFSIIAHDLRSPFNSLVSILSLNDMNLLNLEELKELLNGSRKNIEEIHHTLDNLLYWARNQMESSITHFSLFDLSDVVKGLLSVYQPLALYKSIDIDAEVKGLSAVYADRNQVQLILRNLIDNAIKFTLPGGQIRIRLDQDGERLRVGVSNPVDPEKVDLDGLRKPELHKSTPGTANEKGTGLGLQLCHEYAQVNGGKLEIKMTGDEIEFYFSLKTSS